ncbi:MAG: PLP-dependent aminotransferase family protein [candidate division Zixibacteria bacterium]|nr:PLP-dependent aminotransferase family protein [candidate division Zixibacteria bacterium]
MVTETLPTLTPPLPFKFEPRHFSPFGYNLESSILRDILKFSNQPGVISFAGGLPAPELFPIESIREATDRVLTRFGSQALQYGLSMGYPPLREFIAERVSRRGAAQLTADNILVTAGSQQGLDAVGRAFLDRGDYVVCSRPTYLGALQAFNYYGARYALAEMDDQGMKVETIDPLIREHKPKFIYTVPNFQNPTGITMSLLRRQLLVQKAHQFSVPIVDDNPYGELRYSDEPVPSIKSIGGQAVIQLGTFSKTISPGLRIGWVAASRQLMGVFERVKQSTDLHTNTFAQYVIYEYAKDGALDRHIEVLKKAYHERRDAMLRAMSEFFPDTITWTKPEGGLFLWVRLPVGIDSAPLLPEAIAQKVAFVPGQPFHPDGSGKNTLRLNFSNASLENIHEGIKRLGRVFAKVA